MFEGLALSIGDHLCPPQPLLNCSLSFAAWKESDMDLGHENLNLGGEGGQSS